MKLLTQQDKHNLNKSHVFKFTDCGKIFYNQRDSWTEKAFYAKDILIENPLTFGYKEYLFAAIADIEIIERRRQRNAYTPCK